MPLKTIVCWPPLLLMVRTAFRTPVACGLKVMFMAQPDCGARLAGQALVWLKSPAFLPPKLIAPKASVAEPVFARVIK